MFSPREVIFSKLFYCSSRREQNLSKNVLFLSEAWRFPAREVIAVLLLAAAGNRICRKIYRKMPFFWDFRRRIRHFFGVVLELVRPLEAWCFFPPGGDFFEVVSIAAAAGNRICRKMYFFCQRHDFCPFPAREVIAVLLLTTAGNRICRKILKILFFSDFRRRIRHFFGVVLELARPLEAWCFPPGR